MAKFLYKSIPEYSKEILDILRDAREVEGEVVQTKPLEEYLDNIDTLAFEAIREYIKDIINLSDIEKTPKDYLPYLAYLLGYSWDYDLDIEYQRFILKSIIQLYKRKGTKFNVHYNIAYFDPNVQITEPYKDIFILNQSYLNGKDVFASSDYSWGVYIVKSSYDPAVIKKIIQKTKPAGWKTIFDQLNGMFGSFVPRVRDELWDSLTNTIWYEQRFATALEAYTDYLMWGSWTSYLASGNILYEDPTGYFIKGNPRIIDLPRQYPLNDINAVSSKKRIFNGLDRTIYLQGFGDQGVYLGPTFMYNTQLTAASMGSQTLITTKLTEDKNLFLGHSQSLVGDTLTNIAKANNTDGGSLFKNLVLQSHNDWAQVGPLLPGIASAELGSRQWLEYDDKYIPYSNTMSVYMGLKPLLWSTTTAPFSNTTEEPFDSYGQYKFDQRDLDYYFFIHRAFSPKRYSRSVLYGCRLLDGLLPDDDRLVLSNYDDLPNKGTLIFNNEFIEYEKDIDTSKWVKFYVDGIELKASSREIDEFSYRLDVTSGDSNYHFILDIPRETLNSFAYYRGDTLLKEGIDYTVIERKSKSFLLQDLSNSRQIDFSLEGKDPTEWTLIFFNQRININASHFDIHKHVESSSFYVDLDQFDISFDKSEEVAYSANIMVNRGNALNFTIDLEERNMTAYSDGEANVAPIDQINYVGHYQLQYIGYYDEEHKEEIPGILLTSDRSDNEIELLFGRYGVKNDTVIKVNDVEICDLSATALTDRVDVNFKIGQTSRTIYGASDKRGVFQAWYYEGKKELVNHKDCKITVMPRTIQIEDYALQKIIMVRYHNQPSIPIKRRFISKLGWGDHLIEDFANKILHKYNVYSSRTLEVYQSKDKLTPAEAKNISTIITSALQVYDLPDDTLDEIAEYAVNLLENTELTYQEIAANIKKKSADFGIDLEELKQFKRGMRPRLLVRDDVIDYRYKLHKLNDMALKVSEVEFNTLKLYMHRPNTLPPDGDLSDPNTVLLEPDIYRKEYLGRADAEYNSVYVKTEKGTWDYVAKLSRYQEMENQAISVKCFYRTPREFQSALLKRKERQKNLESLIEKLSDKIREYTRSGKIFANLDTLSKNIILATNETDLDDSTIELLASYTGNLINSDYSSEAIVNSIKHNISIFGVGAGIVIPNDGDSVYVNTNSTDVEYYDKIFVFKENPTFIDITETNPALRYRRELVSDVVERDAKILKILEDGEYKTFLIPATGETIPIDYETNTPLVLPAKVKYTINGIDYYYTVTDITELPTEVYESTNFKDIVVKDIIVDTEFDEELMAEVVTAKLEFKIDYSGFTMDILNAYAIKKEFLSVSEMKAYTGDDLRPGSHVIIKSFGAQNYATRQIQTHTQNSEVLSTRTEYIGSYEFMGKQILPDYIQKADVHLGSHIIDKKYIAKNWRTNYSLNLGKTQKLAGKPTEILLRSAVNKTDEQVKPAVLGGTGNQNNMAFNRSDYVYESKTWQSVGAPVTDIAGKNFSTDFYGKFYRYLIGERKPLGNKVYVEMAARYNYRIDLELHMMSNYIEPRQDYIVNWDFYMPMASGVSAVALSVPENNIFYSLPIRFVENPTDMDFVTSNITKGRTNRTKVVINRSTKKDWSLENTNFMYVNIHWVGTEPVVTSNTIFKLGTRHLLGNTFFSKYPYRYYVLGNVKFSSSDILHTSEYQIDIGSLLGIFAFVTGQETDPIYRYGLYKPSRILYDTKEIAKEKRLFLDHLSRGVLGGTSDENISTFQYKTLLRVKFSQEKLETLVTDINVIRLGDKFLLGNKAAAYWARIPYEWFEIGRIDYKIFEKIYVNPITFIREDYIDPRLFIKEYPDRSISNFGYAKLHSIPRPEDEEPQKRFVLDASSNNNMVLGGLEGEDFSQESMINPVFARYTRTMLLPPATSIKVYKIGSLTPLGNSLHTIWESYPKEELFFESVDWKFDLHYTELNLEITNFIKILPFIETNSNVPIKYAGRYRFTFVSDDKYEEDRALLTGTNTDTTVLGGTSQKYEYTIISGLERNTIYGFMTDSYKTALGDKNLLGNNHEIFYSKATLEYLYLEPISFSIEETQTKSAVSIGLESNALYDLLILDNYSGYTQKYPYYRMNNVSYDNNANQHKLTLGENKVSVLGGTQHNIVNATASLKLTRNSIWALTTDIAYITLGNDFILGNYAKKRDIDIPADISLNFVDLDLPLKVYQGAFTTGKYALAADGFFIKDYDKTPIGHFGPAKLYMDYYTEQDEHPLTLGENHNCILGGTEGKQFSNLELLTSVKTKFVQSDLIPIFLDYPKYKLGSRVFLGNGYGIYFESLNWTRIPMGTIDFISVKDIFIEPFTIDTRNYIKATSLITPQESLSVRHVGSYRFGAVYENDLVKEKETLLGTSSKGIILGGSSYEYAFKVINQSNVENINGPILNSVYSILGKKLFLGNNADVYFAKLPITRYFLDPVSFNTPYQVYAEHIELSKSYYIDSKLYIKEHDNRPISFYGANRIDMMPSEDADDHRLTLGENHNCILGGTEGLQSDPLVMLESAYTEYRLSHIGPPATSYAKFKLGRIHLLGKDIYDHIPFFKPSFGVVDYKSYTHVILDPITIEVGYNVTSKIFDINAVTLAFRSNYRFAPTYYSVQENNKSFAIGSKTDNTILGGLSIPAEFKIPTSFTPSSIRGPVLNASVSTLGKKHLLGNNIVQYYTYTFEPTEIDLGKLSIQSSIVYAEPILFANEYLVDSRLFIRQYYAGNLDKYRSARIDNYIEENNDEAFTLGSQNNGLVLGGTHGFGYSKLELIGIPVTTLYLSHIGPPAVSAAWYNLGKRFLLGNSVYERMPKYEIIFGNQQIGYIDKLYLDPLDIKIDAVLNIGAFFDYKREIPIKYAGAERLVFNTPEELLADKLNYLGEKSSKNMILGGTSLIYKDKVISQYSTADAFGFRTSRNPTKLGKKQLLGNNIDWWWEQLPVERIEFGNIGYAVDKVFYIEPLHLNIASYLKMFAFVDIRENIPISYTGSYRLERAIEEDLAKDKSFTLGDNLGQTLQLGGTYITYENKIKSAFDKGSIYGPVTNKGITKLGMKALLGNNAEVYFTKAELTEVFLGIYDVSAFNNLYITPVVLRIETSVFLNPRADFTSGISISYTGSDRINKQIGKTYVEDKETSLGDKNFKLLLGGTFFQYDDKVISETSRVNAYGFKTNLALSKLGNRIAIGSNSDIFWSTAKLVRIFMGNLESSIDYILPTNTSVEIHSLINESSEVELAKTYMPLIHGGKYRAKWTSDQERAKEKSFTAGTIIGEGTLSGSFLKYSDIVFSSYNSSSAYGFISSRDVSKLGDRISLGNNLGSYWSAATKAVRIFMGNLELPEYKEVFIEPLVLSKDKFLRIIPFIDVNAALPTYKVVSSRIDYTSDESINKEKANKLGTNKGLYLGGNANAYANNVYSNEINTSSVGFLTNNPEVLLGGKHLLGYFLPVSMIRNYLDLYIGNIQVIPDDYGLKIDKLDIRIENFVKTGAFVDIGKPLFMKHYGSYKAGVSEIDPKQSAFINGKLGSEQILGGTSVPYEYSILNSYEVYNTSGVMLGKKLCSLGTKNMLGDTSEVFYYWIPKTFLDMGHFIMNTPKNMWISPITLKSESVLRSTRLFTPDSIYKPSVFGNYRVEKSFSNNTQTEAAGIIGSTNKKLVLGGNAYQYEYKVFSNESQANVLGFLIGHNRILLGEKNLLGDSERGYWNRLPLESIESKVRMLEFRCLESVLDIDIRHFVKTGPFASVKDAISIKYTGSYRFETTEAVFKEKSFTLGDKDTGLILGRNKLGYDYKVISENTPIYVGGVMLNSAKAFLGKRMLLGDTQNPAYFHIPSIEIPMDKVVLDVPKAIYVNDITFCYDDNIKLSASIAVDSSFSASYVGSYIPGMVDSESLTARKATGIGDTSKTLVLGGNSRPYDYQVFSDENTSLIIGLMLNNRNTLLGRKNFLGGNEEKFWQKVNKVFDLGRVDITKDTNTIGLFGIDISNYIKTNAFMDLKDTIPLKYTGGYRLNAVENTDEDRAFIIGQNNKNFILGGTALDRADKIISLNDVFNTRGVMLNDKEVCLGDKALLGDNAEDPTDKLPVETIYLGNIDLCSKLKIYCDGLTVIKSEKISFSAAPTAESIMPLNTVGRFVADRNRENGQETTNIELGIVTATYEEVAFGNTGKETINGLILGDKASTIGSMDSLGNNAIRYKKNYPTVFTIGSASIGGIEKVYGDITIECTTSIKLCSEMEILGVITLTATGCYRDGISTDILSEKPTIIGERNSILNIGGTAINYENKAFSFGDYSDLNGVMLNKATSILGRKTRLGDNPILAGYN